VRVGTLAADVPPSLDEIRSVNAGFFDVVFVKCAGWVDPTEAVVALDHLYDMEIKVAMPRSELAAVSAISFPGKKHIEIAAEAFGDSRFLKDHRLANKSGSRYTKWLSEHNTYVPTEAPDRAFLVAQDDADGGRRISLIAVSDECRGTGIGARLVLGVFAMEPTKRVWRVKVSARNHRAIRFYERLGFRMKSVETVYHVWVKGE
jgi:ribosomal protein S18 acetylase RimI-like enzyme